MSSSAPKLKPKSTGKPKEVFVQNDQFVRKNLVDGDESYDVPQYIMGIDDEGQQAVIENPAYDGKKDPNGTLKQFPMSDGPKVAPNGALQPRRYPVTTKAPKGGTTNEFHEITVIRQDM